MLLEQSGRTRDPCEYGLIERDAHDDAADDTVAGDDVGRPLDDAGSDRWPAAADQKLRVRMSSAQALERGAITAAESALH